MSNAKLFGQLFVVGIWVKFDAISHKWNRVNLLLRPASQGSGSNLRGENDDFISRLGEANRLLMKYARVEKPVLKYYMAKSWHHVLCFFVEFICSVAADQVLESSQ